MKRLRRQWAPVLFGLLLAMNAAASPPPAVGANTYSSTVVADAPVSYWRLGGTSGTVAADSTGSNPGTVKPGVTRGQPGAIASDTDTAMGFNGSTGYVSVPNSQSLNFAGDFTLEAWALPSAVPTSDGAIIHKGTSSGASGWQYRLSLTSGNRWRGSMYVGGNTDSVTATVVPSLTTWTYLVLTRAGNRLTLYVNGVSAATSTFSGSTNTGTGILAIGRTGGASSGYFNGRIDEAAVYSRALDAAHIAAHYQVGIATIPAPVASFTASPTTGTAPLTVQFTDTSTGSPTSWTWDFGDGSAPSSAQNPSHAYTLAGTYDVTLTATNAGGSNSVTSTGLIVVSLPPPPVPSFGASPTTGTAPLTVQFTDTSTGSPTSWTWNFGDGSAGSSAQNPSHAYTLAGTYDVTLTATNAGGSNSLTKSGLIVVRSGPVASFTASPTSGTVPLTVEFTDTSTGSPTSWAWDFGDSSDPGDIVTTRNASHTFVVAGTYQVTLTVHNSRGSSSAKQTITVNVAEYPSFGVQGPSFAGAYYSPTSDKAQSKLWWNDGFWWADMFEPTSSSWHIFRLERSTENWVDTGTVIDPRPETLADVLWDGTHLYVASHVVTISSDTMTQPSEPESPAYLFRFSYSQANRTYTLDPGFPGTITTWSSESMTIDKDSTGTLWASWTQVSGSGSNATNAVYVNWSVGGDDATWGTPFVLPLSGAHPNPDDISAIVAWHNEIGIMWSNEDDQTFYWAAHIDGNPTNQWQQSVALHGPGDADDHLNVKTLQSDGSGRVYAAVKTSADAAGLPASAALIDLLVLNPTTGVWKAYPFGTVANCHTRPLVLLDTEHQMIHMFATAPPNGECPYSGAPGSIFEKTASMSNPQFPTGLGTPVIQDPHSPNLNDATSTKQEVTSATGIVVLASNDGTERYWHMDESLGSGPPTPPVASFGASPTSGTAPLTVAFTDTSTGSPTAWTWDFGDGSAGSSAPNPSHTYTTSGTYTVALTVSNAGGSNTKTSIGLIVVSPSPLYRTTVMADNPVAYWRLGETSGTRAADSAGTANGTVTGGVTLGIPGALAGDTDTAMKFNGSSGYVSVPDSAALDVTDNFTVEAWAKPAVLNGVGGAIVHKGGASGYPVWQYRLSLTSANKWRATVFVGSVAVSATDTGTPSTTAWTYLVMTKAGTTLTLYVNGVAAATTLMYGSANTSTGILAIGRTGGSSSDYFNGGIDEVAFYNTALSAARVQAHYYAGIASGH